MLLTIRLVVIYAKWHIVLSAMSSYIRTFKKKADTKEHIDSMIATMKQMVEHLRMELLNDRLNTSGLEKETSIVKIKSSR